MQILHRPESRVTGVMQAISGNCGQWSGSGKRNRYLDELLKRAVDQDDIYIGLALHPFLDAAGRSELESLLFATGKRRRQLSSAPYTPASVLARMARLAADPNFNARLARHPATPLETLRELISNNDSEPLTAAVAAHRNAPADLLAGLKWRGSALVQKALCGNPNTGREILAEIVAEAPLELLKEIAKHPNADGIMLRDLWARGDRYLRGEVAANEHCPADIQEMAEKDEEVLVRRMLASNPAAQIERLVRLLNDPAPQVRAASVRNLLLPAEEVGALSDDPSRQVRRSEAQRAGLTTAVIEHLSEDKDHWVRRWVARNRTTPEDVLRRLALDATAEVRRAVVRNPACPTGLLHELARDPNSWVRAGVAFRQDLPEPILLELAEEEDADILSGIGQNPTTPLSILKRIAEHSDKDIRRAVILNNQAPLVVLKMLLDDPYPLNRAILARHPVLTEAEHTRLVDDPEPQVRFIATQMLVRKSLEMTSAETSNMKANRAE